MSREAKHRARGRHRKTPEQRLAVYRWWAMALVALTVYLMLVVPVQYYTYGLKDPGFVLPTVAVLLAWWVVFTRTWMAWDRTVAARRRATRYGRGAPAQ